MLIVRGQAGSGSTVVVVTTVVGATVVGVTVVVATVLGAGNGSVVLVADIGSAADAACTADEA